MEQNKLNELTQRINKLEERIKKEYIYVVSRCGAIPQGGYSATELFEICQSMCEEHNKPYVYFKDSISKMLDRQLSEFDALGFNIKRYDFSEQEIDAMISMRMHCLKEYDNVVVMRELENLTKLLNEYNSAGGDRCKFRLLIKDCVDSLMSIVNQGEKIDFPVPLHRKIAEDYIEVAHELANVIDLPHNIGFIESDLGFNIEDFRKEDREYVAHLIKYFYLKVETIQGDYEQYEEFDFLENDDDLDNMLSKEELDSRIKAMAEFNGYKDIDGAKNPFFL